MHEEAEKVKVKRDESVEKIDHLLENIEDLKFHEFEDLLYCYNMLLTAYGSIGNTSAVQYYLKEIDPDELIDLNVFGMISLVTKAFSICRQLVAALDLNGRGSMS